MEKYAALGQYSKEFATMQLLADRLERIEFELELPHYGGFEPTISDAALWAGTFAKNGVPVAGVLWPDCNGNPFCIECSLETLREMKEWDEKLGGFDGFSDIPTGIPVYARFECGSLTHKTNAS